MWVLVCPRLVAEPGAVAAAEVSAGATFGTELTFTTPDVIRMLNGRARSDLVEKLQAKYVEALRRRLDGRNVQIVQGKDKNNHRSFRVTYPDGYFYDVTMDGAVLEVVLDRSTVANLESRADELQKDIFETMALAGMKPHESRGGGHIHIGLKSMFNNDAVAYRNFIVDYLNHPELATMILRDSSASESRHYGSMPGELRKAAAEAIAQFDLSLKTGTPWTMKDLAAELQNKVTNVLAYDMQIARNHRVFAINLDPIFTTEPEDRTVEIRAIRPARDMKSQILIMRLFEARNAYLKKKGGLVPYLDADLPTYEAGVESYRQYAEEAGIPFATAKTVIPRRAPVRTCRLLGELVLAPPE